MKSNTREGDLILKTHDEFKKQLIFYFGRNPEQLAREVEKLTFITLRRFRALGQFPMWDIDDESSN